MKNNVKKYSVVLLIVVLLAMFLAEKWFYYCQSGLREEEEVQEAVTLNIWYPWTDKNELYEKAFLQAIQEYNEKQQEVCVVPKGMEMELYREKLPSDIASNDTPDIYFCFTDAYLKNIVDSRRVLRMNDYLSDDLENRLQIKSLQNMTYDGSVYGLSFAESAGIFLVNTELFEQYGCKIPENWSELLEACRIFLKNGITPLACSEDNDIGFRMYLEALCMNEAGGLICEEIINGTRNPDNGFQNGVQKFAQLMEMGAFGKIPLQSNTLEVEELFYLSRIPMYYTKNSFIGNIIQKNNPLFAKIDVIPFPGERKMEYLGGVSECFVVNESVKDPQKTVTALEDILQSFSMKLYESGAGLPTWNTGEAIPAEEQAYADTVRMVQEADSSMMFWEFVVTGERMEAFMKNSGELVKGKISWLEFVERLEEDSLFLVGTVNKALEIHVGTGYNNTCMF